MLTRRRFFHKSINAMGGAYLYSALSQWGWAGANVAKPLVTDTHGIGVSLHPSGRYYQDARGKPLFLIGYYDWAAVPDGYFIDHPSRYKEMMRLETPYGLNYIRISLGVNRMTASTHPPSWNGVPTPVPFRYVKTEAGWKVDLEQWDTVFWQGLKEQCDYAKRHGFIAHLSIFDGVDLRMQGGASFGYENSFWNPANHCKKFYSSGDYSDSPEGFYRVGDFISGDGIGYFQKRVIDKVCSELTTVDNVFYELGNDLLSSNSAWNKAVIQYIQTKTDKPVSQENNGGGYNQAQGVLQGWSQHDANNSSEIKLNVAKIVGHGYPAWEDPDGPKLCHASSYELRIAAWNSFTGGAAGFGGFTTDFWTVRRGFQRDTARYYGYLQRFIQDTQHTFAWMIPHHEIISNPMVNSCLARRAEAYIAYIPKDAQAVLNLHGIMGKFDYRFFNPQTGGWTPFRSIVGGKTVTFQRPSDCEDWTIYLSGTGSRK